MKGKHVDDFDQGVNTSSAGRYRQGAQKGLTGMRHTSWRTVCARATSLQLGSLAGPMHLQEKLQVGSAHDVLYRLIFGSHLIHTSQQLCVMWHLWCLWSLLRCTHFSARCHITLQQEHHNRDLQQHHTWQQWQCS